MQRSSNKSKSGRASEEARFDFRDSTTSNESFTFFSIPWRRITDPLRKTKKCLGRCCHGYEDSDDDSDDDSLFAYQSLTEKTKTRNRRRKLKYAQRKISYYGTVHMNLAQQNAPIVDDDLSPTPATILHHQQQQEKSLFLDMRNLKRNSMSLNQSL